MTTDGENFEQFLNKIESNLSGLVKSENWKKNYLKEIFL